MDSTPKQSASGGTHRQGPENPRAPRHPAGTNVHDPESTGCRNNAAKKNTTKGFFLKPFSMRIRELDRTYEPKVEKGLVAPLGGRLGWLAAARLAKRTGSRKLP